MHRGEGLRFAPARQAAADALRPSADGNAWALAQRFVAPQLLFDQRPFYIRHALMPHCLALSSQWVAWCEPDKPAACDCGYLRISVMVASP